MEKKKKHKTTWLFRTISEWKKQTEQKQKEREKKDTHTQVWKVVFGLLGYISGTPLWTGWLEAIYLTSLSLSFPICQLGITLPPRVIVRFKWADPWDKAFRLSRLRGPGSTCRQSHLLSGAWQMQRGVAGHQQWAVSSTASCTPPGWCGWWGPVLRGVESWEKTRLLQSWQVWAWGHPVGGWSASTCSSWRAEPAGPHPSGVVMLWLELAPFSVNVMWRTFPPNTVKHLDFILPSAFSTSHKALHYFKEWNNSVKMYLENFASLRCWKIWIGNPNYFDSKVIKL